MLVCQGAQDDVVARSVVDNGQRVAAAAVGGKMAFEIHLPQCVGVGMLETLPVVCRMGVFVNDASVAVQYGGDGAGGDVYAVLALQYAGDFAAAPCGMFVAYGEYLLFGSAACLLRAVVRTAGLFLGAVAFEPFVGGFAADAELSAQTADVAVGLSG